MKPLTMAYTFNMTPRMEITLAVLEVAKDANDAVVIAACRRIIEANRIGWGKHGKPADLCLVLDFYGRSNGGTISDKGRDARDIMLGLAKTCMKLKLSFYEFIGARLGIPGPKIPPLASLIRPAPA